ncbi:MAG TPA: STAS domain-containing protein [Blastocatellia bacterium]|nr:STAS domain-containing protein [Blastocatellia bacterium]
MCRIRTRVINPEVAVVEVSGRLDPGFERDGIYRAVEKLLAEGWRTILLELSRVTLITSLGVGSLINVLRLVTSQDGALKLVNPSLSVRKILSVSNLDSIFEVYVTEDEALGSSVKSPDPAKSKPSRRKRETQ